MSSRSAERGLFGLAMVGLTILSVHPVGVAEKALDVALLPVRLLSEAARPVGLLRMRQVRAAEGTLDERKDTDFERREQLFRSSESSALPDEQRYPRRRFVLAEAVERDPNRIDWVTVDLESGNAQGIEIGLPVVSGDVYVGRIKSVDRAKAQAVVALITGRDTLVGARVEPDPEHGSAPGADPGQPVQLVVGGVTEMVVPQDEPSGFLKRRARNRRLAGSNGLVSNDPVTNDPASNDRASNDPGPAEASESSAPRTYRVLEDQYLLAVHNPNRRELPEGHVIVDEAVDAGSGFGYLANGFSLGRPVENGGDSRRKSYGVQPMLDYSTGLFQLVVVCPPDTVREGEIVPVDVLMDPDAWRAVAVTSTGDPSAWREGLKIGAGWWDGVHPGAALVSGSYLVGRIEHAGVLSADVALLGDPGFHVPALARIEGSDEPLVLGSLVTLGREPDGLTVRFLWSASEPRTVPGPVRAEIFTGSGERRVPRGLLLGEAELPPGPGEHIITVEQPVDTRDVRRLFVRVDRPGTGMMGSDSNPDGSAESAP